MESFEVLHVTYGAVLDNPVLRQGRFETLHENEGNYTDNLQRYFSRHFALLE